MAFLRALRLLGSVVLTLPLALGACAGEDPASDTPPPSAPEKTGSRKLAATGTCDAQGQTSADACIAAIQAAGGKVKNEVFKDSNGKTADQLPVFGKLFNQWPGCDMANCAGCNPGVSKAPFDCPGEYDCAGSVACTFDTVAQAVGSLDRKWGHPCRLASDAMNGACPTWSCIGDGVGGQYNPWQGMVFDLGGPSNKVAIFAENDHGPQPCESLEYTVYLTDNPFSKDIILAPTTTGADPQKWNRAVLKEIYTEGFVKVRDHLTDPKPACGDTSLYSVEEDSMVEVYALPCGITFRYAAIVAGNDGLDFPECQYHSSEAELDAVAGLTETGAGVCPDADGDLYVDCACPGAPAGKCDCNDKDPKVHPGAPEKCDDADLNCDGKAGGCDAGLVCHLSLCLSSCNDKGNGCTSGATCSPVPNKGDLCVPADCTVSGTCPPGSTCNATTKKCVPQCDGVKCPVSQVCLDGACVDPCKGIVCPQGQTCDGGKCRIRCDCFDANVGCPTGGVCDKGNTNTCVDAPCTGVKCAQGEHCEVQGGKGVCLSLCANVTCPQDGSPCTDAVCDPVLGCIQKTKADGASCANSDKCDGDETCKAGKCIAGVKPTCDDKNPCTVDACDPTKGCVNAVLPDGTACSDGDACNGAETCKTGACKAGTPLDCDDKNACTKDSCDVVSGCKHDAITGCGGSGGSSGAAGAAGKAGSAGTAGAAGAAGTSGSAGKAGSAGSAGTAGAGGAGGKSGSAGAAGSGTAGGAGKAGAAGGTATGGGAGAGGGSAAGPAATDDAGESGSCGCRTVGSSQSPAGALGLGLVALAVATRRRRKSA